MNTLVFVSRLNGRRCFIPGTVTGRTAMVPRVANDERQGWVVRRLDWLGRPRGEVVETIPYAGMRQLV